MALYKIQGKVERQRGIYYEFDSEDEPLGEGGMGKVYKGKCVDETTGKSQHVAVKFMYSDLPPYAIEKAKREAAIHFRHDNLIEMLGFIETEGKTVLGEPVKHYHVVSELLEGVSLDRLFDGKLTDQQGHFVPYAEKLFKDYQQDANRFSVFIIKNILSGLMMMHDAGYIHRDIDPTNIMVTSDGHIKLIDFGIAKQMRSLTTNDKHLTQAGQFVGKPEYASPELVLGAINEQNQTTDVYAVGILLFQCIVGHPPFEGDRSDVLQKQLHAPMPLKLIRHKGLRKIVQQATEKSRQKRFQSAAEFRVALERVDLSGTGLSIDWKPAYGYIVGGVAASVLAGTVLVTKPWEKPKELPVALMEQVGKTAHHSPNYPEALTALKNTNTLRQGLVDMERLSEQGDGDASYLLSRLFFKSNLKGDVVSDSVTNLQNRLNIKSDNLKAHQYLQKAVEQSPRNYRALYDLACDYWKAEQRTEAVPERDGAKAEFYFREARSYASEAKDEQYVQMIDGYLSDLERWKAIVKSIKK